MTILIPKRIKRDVAAEFRVFAQSESLSAPNGRLDFEDRTRQSIASVLRRVDFQPHYRVLDIGCGDGRLLHTIQPVAVAVGTVLTKEEHARLVRAPHLAGIHFCVASYDDLPSIPGKFDRIILNSSLSNAGSKVAGLRALQNIVELLEPGGKLWLGELFAKASDRREFKNKVRAFLWVRRRYGKEFSLAFARHILKHWRRANRIVDLGVQSWWYVTPQEIPDVARHFNLKIVGVWNCQEETGDEFYALNDRFSVLFIKA